MYHSKWHLMCCGPKVLWTLSFVALILAWVASASSTGLVFKIPVAHLFWDSLILGVLAIGLKGCDHGEHCGMSSGEEE